MPAGLVTQSTDGRGVVANMAYDAAGRLLTVSYPADTAQNVTYTYDAASASYYQNGRLTKITDGSGFTANFHEARGNVKRQHRKIGAFTHAIIYTYNAADQITQINYPSGRIVYFTRNSLGQITQVTTRATAGATLVTVASGITWKPMSGLLSSLTHGNGLVTGASYDLDYRLTALSVMDGGTPLSSLSYGYGDGLNLTAVNDNVVSANSAGLSYTPANRLATANGPWGNASYSYDGVGNRLNHIVTQGGTTTRLASYGATSNRITGMTENGAALRSYTYDGNGNILTDTRPGEVFAFTYNVRNRPTSVTRNSVAYATYVYNGLEQLVSRTTSAPGGPTGTVHYIYDLAGHLIAEADGATGTTTREYLWLNDLPIGLVQGGTLYMVHTDHLGRPIRITDAARATRLAGHLGTLGRASRPSLAPWPSTCASPASASRSKPACTTTGTGITIRSSAATPSPTRSGLSMGRVCMRMRGVARTCTPTRMVAGRRWLTNWRRSARKFGRI